MAAKVSVVLPTYNRAWFLRGAIRSVLAQTVQDWELIIVDDGSTDDSRAVIERFKDLRIRVLYREHEGQNLTMRAGVEASTCPLIAFLSSDDELPPNALADYLVAMERDWVDVVYGDTVIEHIDSIFGGTAGQRSELRAVEPEALPYRNVVWGCMFRRSMYDALGGWPTQWEIAADYAFWLSAYASGFTLQPVHRITYIYRYHVGGQTFTKRRKQLEETDAVQAAYKAGRLAMRQPAGPGF